MSIIKKSPTIPMLNCELLEAIEEENIDHIQYLVDAGANPNVKTDGGTPILLALIEKKKIRILNILLLAGANLEIKDKWGDTPLLSAIKAHKIGIAKILLSCGANINAQDEHGESAIELAHIVKDPELKELLEEAVKKQQ